MNAETGDQSTRWMFGTTLADSGIPISSESWDYDPTGNWRGYHAASNGASTLDQHRVHDRGNRPTQIEGNPNNMILDRVGRMRQMAPDAGGDWEGVLELTLDAWSRIIAVKNNGEIVGEYGYDGRHRRITRVVDDITLHSYYNDSWRPVEERKDSATTASLSYLWGARHRDDLVRRDRAVGGTTLNETRYVLMDYFNPAAITDETGTVKERYAFSAFGMRTVMNPDYTVRSNSESAMEFAFQGQVLDVESEMMNYGYRYYSPHLGRWTCKDPIAENAGNNMYEMLGNSPISAVDFLGLLDLELISPASTEKNSSGDLWNILWDRAKEGFMEIRHEELAPGRGGFTEQYGKFKINDVGFKDNCWQIPGGILSQSIESLDFNSSTRRDPMFHDYWGTVGHELDHIRSFFKRLQIIRDAAKDWETKFLTQDEADRAKALYEFYIENWILEAQQSENDHDDNFGTGTPPPKSTPTRFRRNK